MKKQLIALTATFAMFTMLAVPAFATDGAEATAPKGSEGVGNASTGAATISRDLGADAFLTENDDDDAPKDADAGGADINIWAKVIDSSSKVYKIDVAWGNMKFEYSSGQGTWDVESHTYTGGSGQGAWETTYQDGTNNKITVTNHSNTAVDAHFAYAMETDAFNENAEGANSVVGNFFADNDKATAAAQVLTETATGVQDELADGKISLETADAHDSVPAGARSGDAYFAFSGTPDTGKGATLQNFTKVGVITLTISDREAADAT